MALRLVQRRRPVMDVYERAIRGFPNRRTRSTGSGAGSASRTFRRAWAPAVKLPSRSPPRIRAVRRRQVLAAQGRSCGDGTVRTRPHRDRRCRDRCQIRSPTNWSIRHLVGSHRAFPDGLLALLPRLVWFFIARSACIPASSAVTSSATMIRGADIPATLPPVWANPRGRSA